jgi:hypothetical protein
MPNLLSTGLAATLDVEAHFVLTHTCRPIANILVML